MLLLLVIEHSVSVGIYIQTIVYYAIPSPTKLTDLTILYFMNGITMRPRERYQWRPVANKIPRCLPFNGFRENLKKTKPLIYE